MGGRARSGATSAWLLGSFPGFQMAALAGLAAFGARLGAWGGGWQAGSLGVAVLAASLATCLARIWAAVSTDSSSAVSAGAPGVVAATSGWVAGGAGAASGGSGGGAGAAGGRPGGVGGGALLLLDNNLVGEVLEGEHAPAQDADEDKEPEEHRENNNRLGQHFEYVV